MRHFNVDSLLRNEESPRRSEWCQQPSHRKTTNPPRKPIEFDGFSIDTRHATTREPLRCVPRQLLRLLDHRLRRPFRRIRRIPKLPRHPFHMPPQVRPYLPAARSRPCRAIRSLLDKRTNALLRSQAARLARARAWAADHRAWAGYPSSSPGAGSRLRTRIAPRSIPPPHRKNATIQHTMVFPVLIDPRTRRGRGESPISRTTSRSVPQGLQIGSPAASAQGDAAQPNWPRADVDKQPANPVACTHQVD